ncbi:MAG: DUF4258 domain-containing protein [Burkholderiales bacterium]
MLRRISQEEIRTAGAQCKFIDAYPADKNSPGVLILGFTLAGRALHVRVSAADSDTTRIITLYGPKRVGRIATTKVAMSTFKCQVCGDVT